jgi:hypothetical protein
MVTAAAGASDHQVLEKKNFLLLLYSQAGIQAP